MQVFVIQDSNGEGEGIPGTPEVFTDRIAADNRWRELVTEQLTEVARSWGYEDDADEDGPRTPLQAVAAEVGFDLNEALELPEVVFVQEYVELRSWVVETS